MLVYSPWDPLCLLKKIAQYENCVIWAKMRTAAWETVPQVTEKLLQRGERRGQYIRNFREEGAHAIKYLSLQKFSASDEEPMSP